jgi:hypothetical protein
MTNLPKRFGSADLLLRESREVANAEAIQRLTGADPRLVGVGPAGKVIPGFLPTKIFTSGPTLPWKKYSGGQRRAIIGGVLYEGLAASEEEAVKLLDEGEISVSSGHEYGCVGSLAGVTTASMPVLIVEDSSGSQAFCTLYEGDTADRLNYGTYSPATLANLNYLQHEIGPALDRVVKALPDSELLLMPIMRRALTMGDELHSRNTAATLLFIRDCLPGLTVLTATERDSVVQYLNSGDYLFLRLSMAASKLMADLAKGVPRSSIVTAMGFSCREFGIQISAYPDRWFRGPLPVFEHHKIFPPYTADDIEFMGGESTITEVCGLGANAIAAALPLQRSSGGSMKALIDMTTEMYKITTINHPDLRIPALDYKGTPLGIDIEKVVSLGITPLLDIGIAGKSGGQIGGGVARAPMEPFAEALRILNEDTRKLH